jgi:hypothetical protein
MNIGLIGAELKSTRSSFIVAKIGPDNSTYFSLETPEGLNFDYGIGSNIQAKHLLFGST